MKNYKNKLLVTLLTVFTLFSFTSCELDYRWVGGTIDYPVDVTVSPSGLLQYDARIDESWIVTRGAGRYPDIHDLAFLKGQIDIYVDRGSMAWLDLRVEGTNTVLPFDRLPSGQTTDVSDAAQHFLAVVTEEIRRYGNVVILIDGEGRPGTKIGIDFGMDLEVYVRD